MGTGKYRAKDRLLFMLTGLLGPWLIRLLGVLCRYRLEGGEHIHEAQARGKGVILALWHGRMLLPLYHFRGRGISTLVSLHRDGELITRAVCRLGYIIRRGSPRKGGREGFMAMLRDLRAGHIVAIFPDGPTGPRHELHDGILHLARLSGAAIVPLSFATNPAWRTGSWDRYMIPKPFSRGIIIIDPPFNIPRRMADSNETEGYRRRVQEALMAVERAADARMGVDS